jgi:hypothetical protein
MEFLMCELHINSCKIASIRFEHEDIEYEYSYLESIYFDEYHLDDIETRYSEEIGMLSDFDVYPYGFIKER